MKTNWLNQFTRIKAGILASEAFLMNHNKDLYTRIKWVSWLVIATYGFFLYIDFILMAEVEDEWYLLILRAAHFYTFIISVFFIILDKFIKENLYVKNNLSKLVYFYVASYLLIGAVSSINSQRLTGNIDSYVIITITVGALFPLQPRVLASLLTAVHAFFLIGLYAASIDFYGFLTKVINSTAAVSYSLLLASAFFIYRKRENEHKQKLKESELNFRKMFDVNPYPLILTTLRGEHVLSNQKANNYFQSQIANMSDDGYLSLFEDKKEYQALLSEINEKGHVSSRSVKLKGIDESSLWTLVNCEFVEYRGERCILVGLADITYLKEMESVLMKNASIDALTGLMNRKYGMEMLAAEMKKAKELVICFIDINNLKTVNDRYGHKEGDVLIQSVCDSIGKMIGKEDIFFRYGGDEFILAFPDKPLQEVELMWNGVQGEMRETAADLAKPYAISASFGYYHFVSGMEVTLEEMIAYADQEMYKQKKSYNE